MDEIQAPQPPKPCMICGYVGHLTSRCPTLYEDDQPMHTFGGFNDQPVHAYGGYYEQPRHDPYHDTYNPYWGGQLNYGYAEANDYQDYQGYQSQTAPPSSNMHLDEDKMRTLAVTLQSMQQQMD
ncbi:uncharacterized protein LOC122724323 [Manihot esculenta]|uniref:uncharacterized protein LOC122724323 n=1 Tax=Manihot esculenta TaxID=3983 RepID=UPI001CC3B8D5|nr:uncharacterized protein LOC122724323 [Manihot esculenta]